MMWVDLSAADLASLRQAHPKAGLTPRDLLAKAMGLADPQNPRQAILLDLYVHTLQFGQQVREGRGWGNIGRIYGSLGACT